MDKLVQDARVVVNSSLHSAYEKLQLIPGSQIIFRYIRSSYQNDPIRSFFELLLLLFAIRYFLASKYSYNKQNYVRLTEKEIQELVDEWQPEPLVKQLDEGDQRNIESIPVISTHNGPVVKLEGYGDREFINLTTTDVYNFNNNEQLKQNAVKAIRKYGVGSCGPAGFYGHQDAHDKCEKQLAEFLGCDGSILYSQGFATASSVIPCFLKRGDVIVADKCVNMGVQKGIQLSRATVFWYEHNDMQNLEETLKQAVAAHRGGPIPRRFLITEGIYESQGDSPDLKKMLEFKHKYKFRILLDESWSLGVLGETGRGLPEYLGIDRDDIDITVGSLATAFGSAGGFCAGNEAMVEHQRITSLAYTFSATMPAYLANLTYDVAGLFADEGFRKTNFVPLRRKAQMFHDIVNKSPLIDVIWTPQAPIQVLRISEDALEKRIELTGPKLDLVMQDIVDEALSNGVIITRLKMLPEHELIGVEYALKVFVNNGLSDEQVAKAAEVIVQAFNSILL